METIGDSNHKKCISLHKSWPLLSIPSAGKMNLDNPRNVKQSKALQAADLTLASSRCIDKMEVG